MASNDSATLIEKKVSIVVSSYNEEAVVESVIREIVSTCEALLDDYQIIAINDGSSDNTGSILNRLSNDIKKLVVKHNANNMGLGQAFKTGIMMAEFENYMLLCGDGGMPASSLPSLFSKLNSADIILPDVTNLQKIKTPFRFFLSKTYTFLLNLIFNKDIHYYNGLPIYNIKLLKKIDINSRGFAFQAEAILKLIAKGATYIQVPVLGAENTAKSVALRPKNIVDLVKTFLLLIYNILTASKN